MGILSSLFKRNSNEPTLSDLILQGAVILDVRTKGEYQQGHIKGSVNIPLDQLPNQLNKLKTDKPVVTCCASGMRSAAAKNLLRSKGFVVANGGGWAGLNQRISRL
jgi:phage shock protein E